MMWLLVTAFAAWFISQLVKFAWEALHNQPDFRLFYRSGGMPSAHAATVTALAIAAMTTEGLMSPVFGLSAVFAAIVIYDTLGVRRASGEQSIMINTISKMIGNTEPVREVLGHTPREVLVGMGLGVLIGFGFTYPAWTEDAQWLVASPLAWEQWTYLAVFTGLTALAIAARLWLRRRRQVAIIKTLQGAVGWGVLLPGLLGLFFSFTQFQTFGPVTWRLWPLLVLVGFVVAQTFLAMELYRGARQRYQLEAESLLKKRKQKQKSKSKAKVKTTKKRDRKRN